MSHADNKQRKYKHVSCSKLMDDMRQLKITWSSYTAVHYMILTWKNDRMYNIDRE